MSLSFKRAEQIRLELTAQQQKEIRDLYQSVADDIADRLSVPQRVPSDALRQWYLRDLQKQVNSALEGVGKTTESTIRSNAEKVAQGVVDCNADWLKSVGMPIGGAFSWVPTDIVTSVATGQIYEGPWSLSGAIWADVQTQQRDIQTIIARGIAENKSAFDIAKDLEKYVDPSAAKPWDWSKVYPGVRRQIDYSAQRLARTMVSHAYQQSFVRTTQKNPFVTKYKWEASNSDRVCELCQERDGKLFSKDDLPLDHPNGMCTYTAVIEDSMDQIADRLADWANGAEDPELDTWAKDMYGDQYKPVSLKQSITTKPELIKAQTSKDITDKYGIPCSKKLSGKCIENLDAAATYMNETFPVDISKYITVLDAENPRYIRSYSAYYDPWEKGVHVHKDLKTSLGIPTWVHEMTHAATGYTGRISTVCDDLVREGFAGIEVKRRNGLPIKSEMAKHVSNYGGTNTMECVAEAERMYFRGDRSPAVVGIHNALLKWMGGLP